MRTRTALSAATVFAACLIVATTALAATGRLDSRGYFSLTFGVLPRKTKATVVHHTSFTLKLGGSVENVLVGTVLYTQTSPVAFLKDSDAKGIRSIGGHAFCGTAFGERKCVKAVTGGDIDLSAADVANSDGLAEMKTLLRSTTGIIDRKATA